ncbi:MAG TPA: Gfo/Idh/MocA family oxidoreductase [Alphaproteobacteria bacterium]|nr:Gfo/Idh/MocA family oxidoreductase [Alphaproteobacteria bacterium]
MAPVALSIIGYGIMGERLLGAALAHDPRIIRVAGVWDPSPQALARLAAGFATVARLPSPEAAIDAADCVYIASPPATHLEHARRAMRAGRALFCEKPLAIDCAMAQAFVADAEAAEARAAINFPFASSFAVDQIKAWIDEGAIGTPRALTIEVAFAEWPRPWQRDAAAWLARRAQGGFTREVVSHFLFLTRRLFGPLLLDAHRAEYPAADASEGAIEAQVRAGVLPVALSGRVGGTDKPDHNSWTLEGDSGAVRLSDWSLAERRGADGAWYPAPGALPNERVRPLVLRRQLDKVACLTRGEAHDLATLREALDVQEIVEAMLGE